MTKHFFTLCLALFVLMSGIAQAKLYRWVDENGEVHYTDKIPPQYSQKAHTELDQHGLKVDEIQAAKTHEQVLKEKELKRLRAERQKLVDIQRSKDRVLLRTFRSIDDIVLARNGKLAAIDVSITVTEGNIKRMKTKLAEMQDNAANLEKQGKSVSKKYLSQIKQIRDDIRSAYSSIVEKEKHKQSILAKFETDIDRFKQLKQLTPEQIIASNAHKKPNMDNIIHCATKTSCDERWQHAEAFVRKHATTSIQILGNNIVVTKQPVKGFQLSVSMSRIADKKGSGATLFVDIQCSGTLTGRELCEGPKSNEIKKLFRQTFGPDEHLDTLKNK